MDVSNRISECDGEIQKLELLTKKSQDDAAKQEDLVTWGGFGKVDDIVLVAEEDQEYLDAYSTILRCLFCIKLISYQFHSILVQSAKTFRVSSKTSSCSMYMDITETTSSIKLSRHLGACLYLSRC